MPIPLHRYSINTATLGYQVPILETIDAVARAGFGGIAPWRREIEGGDVARIAKRIRDAGLRVTGYCRSSYIPASSKEGWAANVEDNRKALADAAKLGAECFVLVVGGLPPGSRDLEGARNQVREGIAALLAEAVILGIPLAIEPLHPMYAADRACINTVEQALDLCTSLDPQCNGLLGVAIDVYHTWWDPQLDKMIARAGREKRILAYHINDWLVPTGDLLMDRGMPGEGVIDLKAIGGKVREAGYGGLIEVEVFSNRIWELSIEEILSRSIQHISTV
jgi:sugar phosphate isomerase/epimerase